MSHENGGEAQTPSGAKTKGDAPNQAEHPSNGLESQVIQSELQATDLEMARVLEDLIAGMIDRGVIMMTDLPKAAQDKIQARGNLRSRLGDLGDIVGDNEEIMLP